MPFNILNNILVLERTAGPLPFLPVLLITDCRGVRQSVFIDRRIKVCIVGLETRKELQDKTEKVVNVLLLIGKNISQICGSAATHQVEILVVK